MKASRVPVIAIGVVGVFASKAEAARTFGVTDVTIHRAVENGTQVGGVWWRYPDMPAECQPFRDRRLRPVRRDDKTRFASLSSVVSDFFVDGVPDRATYHREEMALRRAIIRRRPWHGRRYRFETIDDQLIAVELPARAKVEAA